MTVQDDLINFRDGTTVFSLLPKNEGRFCCFCDKKTACKLKGGVQCLEENCINGYIKNCT